LREDHIGSEQYDRGQENRVAAHGICPPFQGSRGLLPAVEKP